MSASVPLVFVGHVQSGQRDASRWLVPKAFDWHAPELEPYVVRFGREEYGGERDVLLVPCRLRSLGGQRGFLWTTTTAARDRTDPWVIEIVAPVGLRATYGLRDGDEVTVELLQHEVEPR